MLISLDTLLSIGELDERIWTEPVVVADLGSGWGRIGYVLEVVNPRAAYVAIDLPESLLIAQTVLPPLLPQVPVHGYEASREVEAFDRRLLLDGGGIRFCGTHHLPRFAPGSIDVFVNVASFQEMTAPQVAAYLRIAGATSRHVYLQQRWTRPPSLPPNVIGGLADYPFDPAWTRRFVRPVFFSDLFFEAGFSTSGDGDA
jgi:putative sugar O-methyltransferase